MLTLALLALAASAPTAAVQAAPVEETVQIQWKGKRYLPEALTPELGVGPAAAAGVWNDWVLDHDYQMHLDAHGRVLLISSKKNGKVKRQLKLVADTSKLFDELFPAPEREAEVSGEPKQQGMLAPAAGQEDGEIPDDPGGPARRWPGEQAEQVEQYSYEWGAGTWPVDTETCVMFVVRDEQDYADVLARLGELQEYLQPWLDSAKQYTGFVLEQPLIGAYIENATGMEEWDPDNEVVNRVAQMLFVRRFSQLPYWLVQGFAWHIEMKLRKGIYCFPYRAEFIWATEHTGWGNVLKGLFKQRESEPLRLAEFAHWERGSYDDRLAKISFGMAEFLGEFHSDALTPFAEELRLYREEHNRVELGNGSWERLVNYQVPDAELERMLKAHFGPSCLSQVTEFFRKGKSYRLKR